MESVAYANAWRGRTGDLWFPHVYEPNQDPADQVRSLARTRSAGGTTAPGSGRRLPVGLKPAEPTIVPAEHYDTSYVPEAFMDTPVVNGTAYPYLTVEPKAYRFRILNACNDRNLNLQLFTDASGGGIGATATATVGTGTAVTARLPLSA